MEREPVRDGVEGPGGALEVRARDLHALRRPSVKTNSLSVMLCMYSTNPGYTSNALCT